ncbi:MAG: hypothetical protein K6G54_00825 [Oscillospiraceae bacterium]|nr:hypothetical protein [Oscillospiraceae bacterium]
MAREREHEAAERRGIRKAASWWVYRFIRFWVRLFYPRVQVVGAEQLPDEPCIFVGNHAKTNGPITAELYFPVERCTWCTGEMMHLREVPDYAYRDFWSRKPRYSRWLFRIASYLIAPLSVCVFNNAACIGVYRDMRILGTFRETVQKLCEGVSVVIFPEHDVPHNNIVCEFQDRFIDVARMYRKKTGKAVCFVPFYVAPRLHGLYLGAPVRFDPAAPPEQERRRICNAMMDGVTALARALPEHVVVPYPNVPKRAYPTNKESCEQ